METILGITVILTCASTIIAMIEVIRLTRKFNKKIEEEENE